jgi:TIR domain
VFTAPWAAQNRSRQRLWHYAASFGRVRRFRTAPGHDVADIFISYSKQEPQPTQEVAAYLKSEGYSVWWDTNLTSGEIFREVIDRELNAAKAVIVIWTAHSVASNWVLAEADHADRAKKLITLRTKDLDAWRIPKPYSTYHSDIIDNREAILAAVRRIAGGTATATATGAGRQPSGPNVSENDVFLLRVIARRWNWIPLGLLLFAAIIEAVRLRIGSGTPPQAPNTSTPASREGTPAISPPSPLAPPANSARAVPTLSSDGPFADNFDADRAGSFASGWSLLFRGAGTNYQVIDRAHFVSKPHSFKLVGSRCWSATAYRPVQLPAPASGPDPHVRVSGAIFVGQISTGGCSQSTARISLFNQSLGPWGKALAGVEFQSDGFIYWYPGTRLRPYVTGKWYVVSMDVNLNAQTSDVHIDDVLVGSGLPYSISGQPTGVELTAGHGSNPTVWFDDISVSRPSFFLDGP